MVLLSYSKPEIFHSKPRVMHAPLCLAKMQVPRVPSRGKVLKLVQGRIAVRCHPQRKTRNEFSRRMQNGHYKLWICIIRVPVCVSAVNSPSPRHSFSNLCMQTKSVHFDVLWHPLASACVLLFTCQCGISLNMQKNLEAPLGCLQSEASLGCPQSKAYPYKLQDNGNSAEDFPELKNGQSAHPGTGAVESASSLSNDSFAPPNEGYHRSMYQQDFYMWSNFHPDSHKVQQNQWNGFESFSPMHRDYHFPVESRVQYVPFRMFPQCYPQEVQFQDFQYFVVIDFEATCDKNRNPHPQEIIEFPSVLVNSVTGQLEASFQTYVRPVYHQHLSDFCKELTGIQQIQVDRGVPLSEALLMHDKWLEDKGIKHTNFAVVTWSNWDCRVMLESECRFKRIRKPPYFNRWINLRVPFNEVFGGVRCNLKEAVQLAGLVWEGRAHCGLDDARNTARLLTHIMHRGFRFSITNSLMWHTAESQFAWHHSPDRPMVPSHYHHKPKPLAMPFIQFYPAHVDPSKERRMYCFCGVKSSKRMVRKPGPDHGSIYFGCGNWTAARGAVCPYFERAYP